MWYMKYTNEYVGKKIKHYNICLDHAELKATLNFTATPFQIETLKKTQIFVSGSLTINQKRDLMTLWCEESQFSLNSKGTDIAECLLWLITSNDKYIREDVFYSVTPMESEPESESDSGSDYDHGSDSMSI